MSDVSSHRYATPGLHYVYNRDEPDGYGPGDLMPYHMEGKRRDADHIQLAAMTRHQIDNLLHAETFEPVKLEPRVPFRALGWPQFTPSEPYDFICLARSPSYTPATCDPLFDAIREQFIDEQPLAP